MHPLFFAASAMAGGIAAQQKIGWSWLPIAFLLGGLAALRFCGRLPAVFGLIFFGAAALLSSEQDDFHRARASLPAEGQTAEFRGVIDSLPCMEKDRVVIRAKIGRVYERHSARDLSANVELHIYSSVLEPWEFFFDQSGVKKSWNPPLPGDPVRFWGDLRSAQAFQNPGRLWLERRLCEQRIHGVAILKSPWLLDYQPQNVAWKRLWLAARGSTLLRWYWPENSPIPAFVDALLWGDRYRLPENFILASQSVGVYHLLVVSGMHFALILGIAAWIARRLLFPFALRAALFAGLSAAILIRLDAGPSVVRAFLVSVCLLVSESLWRKGSSLNFLGAAGLLALCWQPMMLFNPGFQFSFLCCVVLICIAPPVLESLLYPLSALRRCWSPVLDLRRHAASRDARSLRFHAEALLETHRYLQLCYWPARAPLFIFILISKWLVVAFLIQNETWLLSTFHSNQGPGPALLANLVLLPVTSVVLLGGLILSVCPITLSPLAWLIERLVCFCYGAVYWFDRWSLPDHPHPTEWLLLPLILMIGLQIVIRSSKARQVLVLVLFLVNLGWFFFADQSRKPRPGVYFFDVGQGDSAAVLDGEGRVILIDAGTFPLGSDGEREESGENAFLGRNVLSRALWQAGARKIEGIFVSHLHEDHVSAVSRLARNLRAPRIYLSRAAAVDPLFPAFVSRIPEGTQIVFVSEGERFELAHAIVEVLHPGKKTVFSGSNESSLVLRIQCGGRTFLFTGDMTRREEEMLAGRVGAVDILKVAHHGSASSTSQAWLAELRPTLTLISCGRRNLFDHPHPVVLDRLISAGASIHRTDQDGFLFIAPR
ncbi:MAG TPA: ComEC/Rec2 family competence protein [Acidobacteriota bacterium]